jgi:hypothetical protein
VERVAAIGGIDQRQLFGVLAQDGGDALEHPGSLERRHVAPFGERRLGRGHGGIDVIGAAIGHGSKRLAGTGIDRIRMTAGFRLVPFAAVIGAAVLGQDQGLRLDGFQRNCGVHDLPPTCLRHRLLLGGAHNDLSRLSLPGLSRQSRLSWQGRANLARWPGQARP